MTYNVGDRVSWFGDPGTVRKTDVSADWPYLVEFDEGGTIIANEWELEEA